VIAEFERDRRDLLRRGIAVGGAALAATSIPLLLSVRTAFAQADGDAGILESAVGLEQVAVFAYTAAIDSGLLDRRIEDVARLFRDQEQEHADALITALRDLGGTPPPKPRSAADVDAAVEGLGDVRSQADVANFAIELETAAVAAYYDAHQKLRDAKLLQTGASIMANEGQHLVVLRQAVRKPPVPNAFETGEQ
jgi:rubrerythrin